MQNDILKEMIKIKQNDLPASGDKCFGYIYNPGEEALSLMRIAYNLYSSDNTLDSDAFPSSSILESFINKKAIEYTNANKLTADSIFTTGGSESIFLSVLAHREWQSVESPNMLIPVTAHPAFRKACFYLGIEPIMVPVDDYYNIDINFIRKRLNNNTISLVGSAPSYGIGQVDNIETLGKLAKSCNIGLIVDACVGGGILPFIKNSEIKWDFSVSGVTAITLDWHKWFMSMKGSSSVIFKHKELVNYATFSCDTWMGYSIVNKSITSTRSSGNLAATYAILRYMENKYENITKNLLESADRFKRFVATTKHISLVGDPKFNVFSIYSETLDIHRVQELLRFVKGWYIQPQPAYKGMPKSCHISISNGNMNNIEDFIKDLMYIISVVNSYYEW